jgi:hypothetical protein
VVMVPVLFGSLPPRLTHHSLQAIVVELSGKDTAKKTRSLIKIAIETITIDSP